MTEHADRTSIAAVDASQRVGEARTPLYHGDKTAWAALNVRRDVGKAREAYGQHQPALNAAASAARQAMIADRVEELDGRILDLIVAAIHILLERGYESTVLIWAHVERVRDELPPDEPKIGVELPKLTHPGGDTAENLLRVIAGAERVAEQLRTAFPQLTVRHA